MGATITQFPDGVDVAGPTIARLVRSTVDYNPEFFPNEDGGADVNVQPCGMVKLELSYEGISAAEVATLRTHFNLAKSQVNNFPFYDRELDQVIAEVSYESFRVGRRKRTWSNVVSIVLVHYE